MLDFREIPLYFLVHLLTIASFIDVILAVMNIRNIVVIDGDIVNKSNLSRQIFYKETYKGRKSKVDSLQEYIENLNSKVKYSGIKTYISKDFFNYKIFENIDLIIHTSDKLTGKIDLYVDNI